MTTEELSCMHREAKVPFQPLITCVAFVAFCFFNHFSVSLDNAIQQISCMALIQCLKICVTTTSGQIKN